VELAQLGLRGAVFSFLFLALCLDPPRRSSALGSWFLALVCFDLVKLCQVSSLYSHHPQNALQKKNGAHYALKEERGAPRAES
jgi:hypothetical protein